MGVLNTEKMTEAIVPIIRMIPAINIIIDVMIKIPFKISKNSFNWR